MTHSPEIESTNLVSLYLRETRQTPLLSPQEERELFSQKIKGDEAEERLASQDGHLSLEEKREFQQSIEQGKKAKETLILSNRRLVISVAKLYRGRGVPFLDLIQEGNMGLIKAVDRFDIKKINPETGEPYRFSTYGRWWIRQVVSRAVAEQGRTIRIPGHASEELSRFRRKTIELTARFGREPTLEELAKELGWSRQRAERVTGIPIIACSLDEPVGVEEDSYLGEFIKDVDTFPPSEAATEEILGEQLRKAVDSLKPREAEVLSLRFGLVDGNPRTLSEVAEEFNLSRERIRQIQAEALRKLRHPSRTRGLRDYLEKG